MKAKIGGTVVLAVAAMALCLVAIAFGSLMLRGKMPTTAPGGGSILVIAGAGGAVIISLAIPVCTWCAKKCTSK